VPSRGETGIARRRRMTVVRSRGEVLVIGSWGRDVSHLDERLPRGAVRRPDEVLRHDLRPLDSLCPMGFTIQTRNHWGRGSRDVQHAMRMAWITMALTNGAEPEDVQSTVRHVTPATTPLDDRCRLLATICGGVTMLDSTLRYAQGGICAHLLHTEEGSWGTRG
jgi:hypothetical protein